MFEGLIEQIETLLKEDLEKELHGRHSYDQISNLRKTLIVLKEDLEILKHIKHEDLEGLMWYAPQTFQGQYYVSSSTLENVITQCLKGIYSNLKALLNNTHVNYDWVTNCINFSRILHTILSDFGFDIRYRKEIVRRGIREVRKGLKQIEDFLKDAKTQKAKIDEITKEVENASEKLKVIEELYDKVNSLKDELEQLEIKKNEVDEEYQEFLERKSIFNTALSNIEELQRSFKELSEKLKERQGRFDEFLENAKETLDRFRQEQEKELTMQVEEGRRKLEKMEEYKEQIKQTLRWAEIAGLKTAYEERAEDLEIKAERAYKHFIWGVIGALAFAIVVIFGGEYLFKDDSFSFWLARLLLVVPALFVGWWLWKNYRETKLLADEYIHKKILAENLMIGVQTLKERLDVKGEEAKEKFLDPTLTKLLEDPIEKVYKLKVKDEYELSFLEKLGIKKRKDAAKKDDHKSEE